MPTHLASRPCAPPVRYSAAEPTSSRPITTRAALMIRPRFSIASERLGGIVIDSSTGRVAIAFAIEQPDDVEIGDLTIRPTVQA